MLRGRGRAVRAVILGIWVWAGRQMRGTLIILVQVRQTQEQQSSSYTERLYPDNDFMYHPEQTLI